MLVEPGGAGLSAVLGLAVTGHRDDRRELASGQGAQRAGDLVPVHPGQTDVEQHDLRRADPRFFEGGGSIAGGPDLVPFLLQQELHRVARVGVVVDHENAPPASGAVAAGRAGRFLFQRFRSGSRLRRTRGGKVYDELASLSGAAARGEDRSAVELREPARQRQAQAEAALGPVERRRTLDEEIEDSFEVVGSDARPVVADAERDASVLPRRGDRDASPLRRELDRVVQQVGDHLSEPRGIGLDEERLLGDFDGELLSPLRDHVAPGVDRRVHDALQGHGAPLEPDLPAGDPRNVQEIVHEPRQVLRLAADDLPRLRDQPGIVVPEELDCMQDRGERIAQLVREHREELVLAAVRFDQLLRLLLRALARVEMLGRDRGQEEAGHRENGHEKLERDEAAFRTDARERPQAPMRRPHGKSVGPGGDDGRGRGPEAQCPPDEDREDDVLEGGRRRHRSEGDRARSEQRPHDRDRFDDRAGTAGERQLRRPHEEERSDDEISEPVAQPPHAPEPLQTARGLDSSRPERVHTDRGRDDGTHRCRAEKRHDVAQALEGCVEIDARKKRCSHHCLERVADRDPGRDPNRFSRGRVGDERAEKDAGRGAWTQTQEGGQRQSGRRPHRADLRGLQRERQTELRRAHVEDRDAEPDEKIGAANLPEGTARRGHDCD